MELPETGIELGTGSGTAGRKAAKRNNQRTGLDGYVGFVTMFAENASSKFCGNILPRG